MLAAAMTDRERWEHPKIVGEMWSCEDDYCDCHQPQIDRITPNREAGFPWIKRERLWTGTFKTDGEMDGLWEELKAACAEHGLTWVAWNETAGYGYSGPPA